MSMQRRTARRPVATGRAPQRRGTAWDDTIMNSSLANNTRFQIDLLVNTADAEKRGCTVVRTLLDFQLFNATPGDVSGRQIFHMGIGLVSDDAFAAGGSAMPNPEEQDDYPVGGWMWRKSVAVFDESLANGVNPAPVTIKEDLRAMRKLDRSTMALIIFNATGEGAPFSVQRIGIIRVLYKLP